MVVISLLLIPILLIIAFYDYKYMAVPLLLLILSTLVAFVRLLIYNSGNSVWHFPLVNLTGIMLFLSLSCLILFVIKRNVFNPFNSYIGVGDLLFFPTLCFIFSPINFIVFIIFAFGILLLAKPVFFRSHNAIPLAGGISALLCVLLLFDIYTTVNLFDDSRLIKLLF